MKFLDEFKRGWREAGELHRRVFPWALLTGIIIVAFAYATGWRP